MTEQERCGRCYGRGLVFSWRCVTCGEEYEGDPPMASGCSLDYSRPSSRECPDCKGAGFVSIEALTPSAKED
jgi:hypothetical protein